MPSKANSIIFMPGKSVFSRRAITPSSITPKSSAIIFICPRARSAASNSFIPGPFRHSPFSAVFAPAGMA